MILPAAKNQVGYLGLLHRIHCPGRGITGALFVYTSGLILVDDLSERLGGDGFVALGQMGAFNADMRRLHGGLALEGPERLCSNLTRRALISLQDLRSCRIGQIKYSRFVILNRYIPAARLGFETSAGKNTNEVFFGDNRLRKSGAEVRQLNSWLTAVIASH